MYLSAGVYECQIENITRISVYVNAMEERKRDGRENREREDQQYLFLS